MLPRPRPSDAERTKGAVDHGSSKGPPEAASALLSETTDAIERTGVGHLAHRRDDGRSVAFGVDLGVSIGILEVGPIQGAGARALARLRADAARPPHRTARHGVLPGTARSPAHSRHRLDPGVVDADGALATESFAVAEPPTAGGVVA